MKRLLIALSISFLFTSMQVQALALPLPDHDENVIGSMYIAQSQTGDTLYKLARRYEMGYNDIRKANPRLRPDKRIKRYTAITIPSFFILPDAPRDGIIINLPEMRLYYFPENRSEVITEPIAIGRAGWKTPEMDTTVIEKTKDPYWVTPDSIRMHTLFEKGKVLPQFAPPGTDNPLGQYALRLGNRSILIHGTNDPSSIGKRISSGCIRLYPEDIELLYRIIPLHTPVHIVNQPYKLGWYHGHLYLEVHHPLYESTGGSEEEQRKVHQLIMEKTSEYPIAINWFGVAKAIHEHKGIPYRISR